MEYGKECFWINRISANKRVQVTKDVDFFRSDKNNRRIIKKTIRVLKKIY